MRRHRNLLLTAAAAIAATGIVAGGVAIADLDEKTMLSNPPGEPPFAGPGPPNDPQKKAEREFFDRYHAWLDSPAAQGLDLRSLRRGTLLADFLPGQPSLEAAVAAADLIVLGEAVEYKFGSWGSSVTLKVESMLKGEAGNTITVSLPGGPQPKNLAFTEVTLVEGDAAPILLPGDRAMLFLRRSSSGDGLGVQPYSGHYRIDSTNKVRPLPQNAFGLAVSGMEVEAFSAVIRQRLR
ncbi:MAG: hypothetical protein H0U53_03425 [Actinobacteria bacterium]|nr:hypothetical protein [Actinomycetota bacterium]